MAKEAKDISGEEQTEKARVEAFRKQAAADRAQEQARRDAHKAAVKRAYADSLIVHGPVQK